MSDSGHIVLGTKGAIAIPENIPENEISIGQDGTVSADGIEIGQLQLSSFVDNSTLIPVSQSVFEESRQTVQKPPEGFVQQKYFEASNVNATTELIGLVIGGRLYEAVQKATKTISDSLEQSIRS